MPIFDMECRDCGQTHEIIQSGNAGLPACPACGGTNTFRRLSAPSALTGKTAMRHPGPGDTACCGSSPGAAGCAGPGSCCGKTPR